MLGLGVIRDEGRPRAAGVLGLPLTLVALRLVGFVLLVVLLPDMRSSAFSSGKNMPPPSIDVLKYCFPPTSPEFFPLEAYSVANSTPANVPFLPSTLPMNRTVPCMPPGTLTGSPTRRVAMLAFKLGYVKKLSAILSHRRLC